MTQFGSIKALTFSDWRVHVITSATLICLLVFTGCGGSDVSDAGVDDSVKLNSRPVIVKTAVVRRSNFYSSLQSNGKLVAKSKADMIFERGGIVTDVFVQTGDRVVKGDLIALTDTTILYAELLKAKQYLSKAELQMEDLRITIGGNVMDTNTVLFKQKRQAAYVLSGVQEMQSQLVIAKRNLYSAQIKAPFEGVIEGLSVQVGSLSSGVEKICTVISQKDLWIDFYIIENEIGLIAVNDEVQFVPVAFSDQKQIQAHVKIINPKVEKNGLILVKAVVDNSGGELLDGMNVHLVVKKYRNNVIAIDKRAVQDKQGKSVVFTYVNGLAKWTYVTLGTENADSVEVKTGLNPGDLLVLDGQVNLGHDTEVVLAK